MTGKTALLNAVEAKARSRGWLVVSETATPGFIARLSDDHLPRVLADHDPKAVRHHLTSFGLPANLGRLDWARVERHARTLSFRSKVELLTDLLKETESGLLITLNELHHQPVAELREFGTVAQHMIREQREFAFAAASLPAAIDEVLADELMTFLRRADRHHLGSVDPAAVRQALEQPIVNAGRTITDDALEAMAAATSGYPFMIQLVGDRVWRAAPATRRRSCSSTQTRASTRRDDASANWCTHPRLPTRPLSPSPSSSQWHKTTDHRLSPISGDGSAPTRTTRASTGSDYSVSRADQTRWARPPRVRTPLSARLPTRTRGHAQAPEQAVHKTRSSATFYRFEPELAGGASTGGRARVSSTVDETRSVNPQFPGIFSYGLRADTTRAPARRRSMTGSLGCWQSRWGSPDHRRRGGGARPAHRHPARRRGTRVGIERRLIEAGRGDRDPLKSGERLFIDTGKHREMTTAPDASRTASPSWHSLSVRTCDPRSSRAATEQGSLLRVGLRSALCRAPRC